MCVETKPALYDFRKALIKLRSASQWHTPQEFSYQVGLYFKSYKRIEEGGELPAKSTLERIFARLRPSKEVEAKIWELWARARLERDGVYLPEPFPCESDLDDVSEKIKSEVIYILKQEGVYLRKTAEKVIRNRIAMILKSMLGE